VAAQEDLDLARACGARTSALPKAKPPPVGAPQPEALVRAWTPWAILSVFVFIWGLPPVKSLAQRHLCAQVPDRRPAQPDQKVPPVVPTPHFEARSTR
jgi:lactate permease